VKMITCHSEPERSEGEESRCYLTKESLFTRNETLRSLRSLRVTYGWSTRAHPVTCTTYSRSSGWRWRARLAASTNSLRVSINWSVVSGVNDTSPHFGQTQAGTSGIVTPMPSSLYLKVVVPHSITSPHSEQWGAGLCSLILVPDAESRRYPRWVTLPQ
jgi:hypothetical protein